MRFHTLCLLIGLVAICLSPLAGDPQVAGIMNRNVAMVGTYAERPLNCEYGTLFFPSPSSYTRLICGAGSVWQHYRYGMLMQPPVLTDFAWVNQGASTTDTSRGGITLNVPALAGSSLRILRRAVPAPPYTVTIALSVPSIYQPTRGTGVLFRESATGRLHILAYWKGTGAPPFAAVVLESATWVNETTPNVIYVQEGNALSEPVAWFQLSDDGVNRILRFGSDGTNFLDIHSVARNDYLVADEVGVFVQSDHAVLPMTINWLHWEVQ